MDWEKVFGILQRKVLPPLNFEELQNLMAFLLTLSTMMKVKGSEKPKRTGSGDDDHKTVKKLKRSEKEEEETELQNNEHSEFYGGEYLADYDTQA